MTGRQKIFIDEFIATQNSTEAARRAGFSAGYANRQGHRLLKNPDIRSAIDARLEELDAARTARTKEILEFLTATLRGEVTETVVTNSGKLFETPPPVSQRLRAAELLLKVFGEFKDKAEVHVDTSTLFVETLNRVWEESPTIGEFDDANHEHRVQSA